MSFVLTGFSQTVDIDNPEVVKYLLQFKSDTGKEFSLPVSQETAESVIAEVYGSRVLDKSLTPKTKAVVSTLETEATVFGYEEEPKEYEPSFEDNFNSEEEVPSL